MMESKACLDLPSAGDVETLTRAHGTHFIVTNTRGDITPAGACELGLLFDDTRYLSRYELSVREWDSHRSSTRELSLVHLSSDASDFARNRIDLMVSGLESEASFLDDPQNFLHVRRRQLVTDDFREQIEIENFLHRPIHVEVTIAFAADFADVFELRGAKRGRRGRTRPAVVTESTVELKYQGLDDVHYATRFGFSPRAHAVTAESATFRLTVDPGASECVEICVVPLKGRAARSTSTKRFEERVEDEREASERYLESCTRFRCDDAVLQSVLVQSTKDLHALSLRFRGERMVAAGIPWFCCPFGRDSLLTAYEALTLDPDLAVSTMRALAQAQGTKFDDFTEEEPGKILHELRGGEMAGCKEIPHLPYYGSIDATPLFVVLAHATSEVTGDVKALVDLKPAVVAALRWIDARSRDGTELVTYERKGPHGLENQGWKDSRAALAFPDGSRAKPPIALVEVQGYCVDAYRRGAALLTSLGDTEAGRTYAARAERLRHEVDERLWLPGLDRYALAVDGTGARLPTIVSNIGHLLWSRVPDPRRARACADLLVAPDSLSNFGIRTLAAGQRAYNPLSYHNGTVWPHDNAIIAKGLSNYDLMDHATAVFDAMIRAMARFPDRRLPELFCGTADTSTLVRYPVACSPQAWAAAAPFLLLQAVLGLHLDGVRHRLLIRNPRMPHSVSFLEIDGLRVGGSRVSLRLRRIGKHTHVDRLDVTGSRLRTFVEIE
jgi:glycogen debranching enzyme